MIITLIIKILLSHYFSHKCERETGTGRRRTLKQTGGGMLYWPFLFCYVVLPYSELHLPLLLLGRVESTAPSRDSFVALREWTSDVSALVYIISHAHAFRLSAYLTCFQLLTHVSCVSCLHSCIAVFLFTQLEYDGFIKGHYALCGASI